MRTIFIALLIGSVFCQPVDATDRIIINAKVTQAKGNDLSAIAINDGLIVAVGDNQSILKLRTEATDVIDAQQRRLIPGINDSHLHVVRGGRFYNLETRWEGVTSLKAALALLSEQAARTPKGQWVRVIGGWSPYQFDEKRLPTPQELNQAAPNTPVFVLHLYSGGVLNKAGMDALGINKDSKAPKGSRYERDSSGRPTGRLVADPNPMILYRTIAQLPQMTNEQQLNSSQQFYRKLLSLGVTSVVDAGGGGHVFPDNYQASFSLAERGELPLRVSNFLFPQKPDFEINSFVKWMAAYKPNQNAHIHLDNGFVVEGGGELLAWKASDYENFTSARPELDPNAEKELEDVVRLHLLQGWPFRLHATYNESIERMLTVFESINKTQPLNKVRWILDHAETISDKNLKRVKALGGAIAVQGRMAFAGEDFLARYGKQQTLRTPPIRKMLELGIPVGLGTDGTRVSSFNPWPTYYWAVSGKTVGGTQLYREDNRLSRREALKLFTSGSAYLSGEEQVKGELSVGMYADMSLLNHDILEVEESELLKTSSVLTIVGGHIKFVAKKAYPNRQTPAIPVLPSWSPVNLP